MFLRWIHNIWKYFWRVVLVLLLTVLIVGGGLFGMLQLDTSKNYMANRIEKSFNNRYYGELEIGDLNGLMPFRFELYDVRLTSPQLTSILPDTSNTQPSISQGEIDTVVTIKQLNTQIDLWSLLSKKLSIIDFRMETPRVQLLSNGKDSYSLSHALRPRISQPEQEEQEGEPWIQQIEIIAPLLTVENGSVYVEEFFTENRQNLNLPEPFQIDSLNTTMFLEWSEVQRFLDFESFSANLPNMDIKNISFSGQIYNDSQSLEFNAFNITTPRSELTVSGQIDGLNLDAGAVREQLPSAAYNFDISSREFLFSEFSGLNPDIPNIDESLNFTLVGEGTVDSLQVTQFDFGIGESYLSLDGHLRQLNSRENLDYQFDVQELFLRKNDLEAVVGRLENTEYEVLEALSLRGKTTGTLDSLNVDITMDSPAGSVALNGFTQLRSPFKYQGSLSARHLDLSPFLAGNVDTTDLNMDASFNGLGFNPQDNLHNISASLYSSSVNGVAVDEFDFEATLVDGFIEHRYRYQTNGEQLSGTGWIDLTTDENQFALEGDAANIDLSRFLGASAIPRTQLDLDYNVQLQGAQADRMQGRANLDVKRSIIGSDTLKTHQIYMDLDSPDLQTRTFRLTSTLFDLSMQGNIKPTNIYRQVNYWSQYMSNRIRQEILLDSLAANEAIAARPEPLGLEGELVTKDLPLIRKYWQAFPRMVSDSRVNFDLKADADRFLLTADARADTLFYKTSEAQGATARMTASFRHDRPLKEFSNIDIQASIDTLHTDAVDLDSVQLDLSLRQDSLSITNSIANISNEARSTVSITSKLARDSVQASIQEFYLGNQEYAWQNDVIPQITLRRNGEIYFRDFRFQNNDEYLEVRGDMTASRQDSLQLVLQDLNLNRISKLVNGRVNFDGTLNGTLVTQSLLNRPSIAGNLRIRHLKMAGRTLGDAQFSSRFNPQKNRFDTSIDIVTDSTRYSDYLSRNDGVGQRLHLDGYFVPPDPEAPQDTVFYFDANFQEIDLWILPYISPNVFQEVEGLASGKGYITGNMEDYDFNFDFQVQNAFTKPEFLNTNYFINGHVVLDRQQWVVLDSLSVTDTKGGTGTVYGSVDLNNFSPITYLDLTMDMNRLHILNSSYDPDVPFYGSMSGTGSVRLSGPNSDLFLRTQDPIEITSDSRLSVPLLEETELSENAKFIRFVNEFNPGQAGTPVASGGTVRAAQQRIDQMMDNLTFSERFNLDLQFTVNNPMTVELIFDRVTGEVLTAQGTGQIRLTMEEENMQMFGRYSISSGRYNFVGGEIFTRQLQLEKGGTIIWEGDPENARLDINAIYNARPSITPLVGGNRDNQSDFEAQRVPIDLVVEISGTLTSVENDYYFRIPNQLDISSNNTLTAQISELNRDEQQKLIQATSILLTGNFISYQNSNEAYSNIGQSFTRRSTYLNPLLSTQVISPLLSNQINALLNSDVSRFDIDFSLNAYNEIDLGVALRLYNDRLILRREGMITSSSENQSTLSERIGDLNATYRINRSLSVMAFHRQEQTLGSVTAAPGSGNTVDGIGLEAQVKFNTWREFTRRIKNIILGIFGAGRKEKEKALASENATYVSDEE